MGREFEGVEERRAQSDGEETGRQEQGRGGIEKAPGQELARREKDQELAERQAEIEPDVLLDVPRVKVDEISLEVDDLRARVSLHAAVGNLVVLDVGADVVIGRVKLEIKGVEAAALLKVRLEKVYRILERTLTTLDNNPKILESLLKPVGETVGALGRTVEETVPDVGKSLGKTVEETVPSVGKSVGKTAEETVPAVGKSVGKAAEETVPAVGKSVGKTAEETVPAVGTSVGKTAEATAPSVGQAVGGAGQAVPEAAGQAGDAVGQAGQAVGEAGKAVPEAAGQAAGETGQEAAAGTGADALAEPIAAERPAQEGPAQHLLFDGSQDSAQNWEHLGAGSVEFRDGSLVLEAGVEPGLVYYKAGRFDDARLQLEFQPDPQAEPSLALRFRNPTQPVPDRADPERRYQYDNQAFVAMHTGFEVQLSSHRPGVEPGILKGVVIGEAEGAQLHTERTEVSPGEWNRLEVQLSGNHFAIRLNDKETSRFENVDSFRGKPAAKDPEGGFIGIVMRGGRMAVRRVEVEVEVSPSPGTSGENEQPAESREPD